jgi:hypothetical protein
MLLPDPTDAAALYDLSMRWENLSTAFGLMRGHLLALDGYGYHGLRPQVTFPISPATSQAITNVMGSIFKHVLGQIWSFFAHVLQLLVRPMMSEHLVGALILLNGLRVCLLSISFLLTMHTSLLESS